MCSQERSKSQVDDYKTIQPNDMNICIDAKPEVPMTNMVSKSKIFPRNDSNKTVTISKPDQLEIPQINKKSSDVIDCLRSLDKFRPK